MQWLRWSENSEEVSIGGVWIGEIDDEINSRPRDTGSAFLGALWCYIIYNIIAAGGRSQVYRPGVRCGLAHLDRYGSEYDRRDDEWNPKAGSACCVSSRTNRIAGQLITLACNDRCMPMRVGYLICGYVA